MVGVWQEFPGTSAITVQVACGGKTGTSGRHPVTLYPDWTVETRHDLELERIAAAFGSKIGCVDLADRRLPCVRQVWLHRQRAVPSGIQRTKDGQWQLISPVHGCGCVPGKGVWRRPEEASAHLRTLQHWARSFKADVAGCNRLIVAIERATGVAFDAPSPSWTASPAVYHFTDLAWLWEVGIHPDEVERIHAGLGLSEPLAAIGYVYASCSRAPLDELALYAADGAEAVCWAASSWLEHPQVPPDRRREWFLAGLNWRLITGLIAGPYRLTDVQELAAATGKSLNRAADLLLGWLAVDCRPTVAEVIACCRLVPHGRQAPTLGALDAVWAATGRERLSRAELGLILVVAGTPTTAIAMIRRGVRTLDDAVVDLDRTRAAG